MALEDYQIALKVKPMEFDATKPMLAAAEYNQRLEQTRNIGAEADRRIYDKASEELGRAAKDILMMPEGPQRTERWNHYVDQFYDKGYLNKFEHAQWRDKPSNLVLNQAIAHATPVATHAQITGQEAGARAAAEYPYRVQEAAPTSAIIRPAQLPGAPQGAVGGFPDGAGPASMGRPGAPSFTGAGGPQIITPTGPAVAQGPQPRSNPADVQAAMESDPIYQEVPKMPEPPVKPNRQGVVMEPKITPLELKQDEAAAEFYDKKIREPAAAATASRAGFGTMRSALTDVNTGRTGEIRATIAAWMKEVGIANDVIKARTGIDPVKDEIMRKESIQDSMKFVRETIGAREALQAIQAVMQAFPNPQNTVEANRAMIDIMDKSSQWAEDKLKYAAQFMNKNDNIPLHKRIDAFNRWWGENYPQARYVSEVVPYKPPLNEEGGINSRKLEKNVNYVMPDGTVLFYRGDNKWTQPPARGQQ